MASSIKERALLRIKADEAERLAAEQAAQAAAISAATERDRLEREARIIAAAERQQALLRAERLEAEQAAAKQAAAEQAALDAEIARLRARTPLEVMQDEMAEMKRQMAAFSRPPEALHLRVDGELDMRFKSSKEELATARAEIAELKKYILKLADSLRWSSMICHRNDAPHGLRGPTQWGCDTAQEMRASDSTLPPHF